MSCYSYEISLMVSEILKLFKMKHIEISIVLLHIFHRRNYVIIWIMQIIFNRIDSLFFFLIVLQNDLLFNLISALLHLRLIYRVDLHIVYKFIQHWVKLFYFISKINLVLDHLVPCFSKWIIFISKYFLFLRNVVLYILEWFLQVLLAFIFNMKVWINLNWLF